MTASRILRACVLTVIFGILLSFPADARNSKGQATANNSPREESNPDLGAINKADSDAAKPPLPEETSSYKYYLSSPEFYLVVIVSTLGLTAFFLQFFLLRKVRNLRSEDLLRVFGVTLVLIGTVFFVSVGFGADQIAPAMGLFGTIAGYLLGRSSREGGKSDEGKEGQ